MSPSGTRIYVTQQVDKNNSLAVKVMGPSDGNQVWDFETCNCTSIISFGVSNVYHAFI